MNIKHYFNKRNVKIMLSSLFSLNLFISLPLGIYYGIPTEPYGAPNNIEAKNKELSLYKKIYFSENGKNLWSIEKYNPNEVDGIHIYQKPISMLNNNEKNEYINEYKEANKNSANVLNDDEIRDIFDNPSNNTIQVTIDVDFNKWEKRNSSNSLILTSYLFKESTNSVNATSVNDLGNTSLIFNNNKIKFITSETKWFYFWLKNKKDHKIHRFFFHTEVFRSALTIKSKIAPKDSNSNTTLERKYKRIYEMRDSDGDRIDDFDGTFIHPDIMESSYGWYDMVIDLRNPQIHNNLHIHDRHKLKPNDNQFFNLLNWVEDKNNKYSISFYVKNINYRPTYVDISKYDDESWNNKQKSWLTFNSTKEELQAYKLLEDEVISTKIKYDDIDDNPEKIEYDYKSLEQPILNPKLDSRKYSDKYRKENLKIILDDDGYSSIIFKDLFYVPNTNNIIIQDEGETNLNIDEIPSHSIYSDTWLVIENDLNGDGKYTPIIMYDQKHNPYFLDTSVDKNGKMKFDENLFLDKPANNFNFRSSIDGETKIFSLSYGQTFSYINLFAEKRISDAQNLYYMDDIYKGNTYINFSIIEPINIIGIFLTSVISIGFVYSSFYYFSRKTHNKPSKIMK